MLFSAGAEWLLDYLLDLSPHSAADKSLLLRSQDRARLIAMSVYEAYAWCEVSFGKNAQQWQWGQAHSAHRAHPTAKVCSMCCQSTR